MMSPLTARTSLLRRVCFVLELLHELIKDRQRLLHNEVGRTIILKRKLVLERYAMESARDIPPRMKGGDGYWAGLAAWARVLAANTGTATPQNTATPFPALDASEHLEKLAMPYPSFGTEVTEAMGGENLAFMGRRTWL